MGLLARPTPALPQLTLILPPIRKVLFIVCRTRPGRGQGKRAPRESLTGQEHLTRQESFLATTGPLLFIFRMQMLDRDLESLLCRLPVIELNKAARLALSRPMQLISN